MATDPIPVSTGKVMLHPALLSPGQRRKAFRAKGTIPSVECWVDPELHTGPCRAESPEERAAREDVARDLCGSCPARRLCADYARRACPDSGVWAGMTPDEIHRVPEAQVA
ncbi:WhiB family transcriptional regulator [Spongiactinospora rosea]|nr:WhiB family transcriptional regulator [Spongiactinospora rosea]